MVRRPSCQCGGGSSRASPGPAEQRPQTPAPARGGILSVTVSHGDQSLGKAAGAPPIPASRGWRGGVSKARGGTENWRGKGRGPSNLQTLRGGAVLSTAWTPGVGGGGARSWCPWPRALNLSPSLPRSREYGRGLRRGETRGVSDTCSL